MAKKKIGRPKGSKNVKSKPVAKRAYTRRTPVVAAPAKKKPGRPRKETTDAPVAKRAYTRRAKVDAPLAQPGLPFRTPASAVTMSDIHTVLRDIATSLTALAARHGHHEPAAPPAAAAPAAPAAKPKLGIVVRQKSVVEDVEIEEEDEEDAEPDEEDSPPDDEEVVDGDDDAVVVEEDDDAIVSAGSVNEPVVEEAPAKEEHVPADMLLMPNGQAVKVEGVVMLPDDTCDITPKFLQVWNEDQMLAVGNLMGLDLTEQAGKPRVMRQMLFDKFVAEQLLTEQESDLGKTQATSDRRQRVSNPLMPVSLKKGNSGLPNVSPVVVLNDVEGEHEGGHIERNKWRTRGRWLRLHLIAEDFREAVARTGMWNCNGYNCHDCVEFSENIDQMFECHQVFSKMTPSIKKGQTPFVFEFPVGAADYASDDVADAVADLEEQ